MSEQSVVRAEAVEVAASSVIYQELAARSQSPPSNLPLIHFASLSSVCLTWLEISEHHVADALFDLKWPSARGSQFCGGRSRFTPGCLLQLAMPHHTEPQRSETED